MTAFTHLGELLRHRARERADQVAVHFPERGGGWRAMTFAEVDAAADRHAAGFRAAGLGLGDRTLLMVRPSADFYGIAFGLFRCGAIPVFIDPGMGVKSMLGCVARIEPTALLGVAPVHAISTIVRKPFRSVRTRITAGPRLWWGGSTLADCAAAEPDGVPDAGGLDDDAVIVFTSGSTGQAKGVSLTHRCMLARVEAIQSMLNLEPGAVISETLLVYTMLEICMGLTVTVPHMDLAKPASVDPAALVDVVKRFGPRYASASPVVWQRLVRHCIAQSIKLPTLELLLTTAAPIPVDLHERLGQVVPESTQLFTPYGATEAMPVSQIGSRLILSENAARTALGEGTCVGEIVPVTEVRILEVTDEPIATMAEARLVEPGQVGEITVRGDGISREYRNAPRGNELAKIRDGDTTWHRMGDLGFLDEAGRLWFCGRKSHRLETADGTVPAVPVEGIYNQHRAVFRTALVGLGPAGSQVGVLVVELEEGASWSDALASELLALGTGSRWEGVVSAILHHPAFPTDARHNSKIRREVLREWAKGKNLLLDSKRLPPKARGDT